MKLIGIDLGTTSCKAGVFDLSGAALSVAARPTPVRQSAAGHPYYAPEELFSVVCETLRDITTLLPRGEPVAVGIASMAETGLLLDRRTGAPRSEILPWFDRQAEPQARFLAAQDDALARFCRTGLVPNAKVSLAKLLWLRETGRADVSEAVWLSAADYLLFRLTGQLATDPSLAGRTYAYRIDQRRWDTERLAALGLPADLFPPVLPSGTPAGQVHAAGHRRSGLAAGTPVAVAGHDHLCAALGAGAVAPDQAFDSMGTAEALLGTLAPRALTQADYDSGLSFGCHAVRDQMYWLGGLSSSGGAIEWLRSVLGAGAGYEQLDRWLRETDASPADVLFFPYLLGSSSSSLNRGLAASRAALIGLDAQHQPADLVKAVLQGTAYELERIRRAAEALTAIPIRQARVSGGGTRNRLWVQIKADVSDCAYGIAPLAEVTLLGAAMLAAIGTGVFSGAEEAIRAMVPAPIETIAPDADRHRQHRHLFEHGYLALQEPLHRAYAALYRKDAL